MFRIPSSFHAVPLCLALAALAGIVPCASGADVKLVLVSKAVLYQQNDASAPAQLSSSGYEFRARVELARTQSVSSASVKLPISGATRSLTNYVSYWETSERFNSSGPMNGTYQNGIFLVNLTGAEGRHTNSLNLFADLYPNPIRVANFDEAQRVDSAADFTLKWDPPGLTAGDFVQVRVLKDGATVFETGSVPGAAGSLGGTASSVLIPKNTFQQGGVYLAEITAMRRSSSDSTGYPGITAWAGYARRTQCPLRTVFSVTDVPTYGIAKIRRFEQSSASAPVPSAAGNAFSYLAFAFPASAAALQSANVKTPSGQQKTLASVSGAWNWSDDFAAQQSLDSAYGSGTYQLALQTAHDGVLSIPLALPAASFPAPPQISNWVEANSIDASRGFVLSWSPLGGGANDFVKVTISKNGQPVLQSSSVPGAADALNGTATSISVPAGMLSAGETAEATIEFLKISGTDLYAYPGARGLTGFAAETKAVLRARGGNVAVPVMSAPRVGNGFIEFTITGDQGRLYSIQGSSAFSGWSDLIFTNAPAASFVVRIPVDARQRVSVIRAVAY